MQEVALLQAKLEAAEAKAARTEALAMQRGSLSQTELSAQMAAAQAEHEVALARVKADLSGRSRRSL